MELISVTKKTNTNYLYSPIYQLLLCCQVAVLSCCLLISFNHPFPPFILGLSWLTFALFVTAKIKQSKLMFVLGEVLMYSFLVLLYFSLDQFHTISFSLLYGLIIIGYIVLCHKVSKHEYL